MNTLFETVLFPLGWLVASFLAAVSLWRIACGPSTLDRLVGLDGITVAAVASVVVFSLQIGAVDFIELVIIVTALGFFTTVAFYYYLAQPKRNETEDYNNEREGAE